MPISYIYPIFLGLVILVGCAQTESYDVILRNGITYDGSGQTPYIGDIAIGADTIAAMGDLKHAKGIDEIDVTGLAVAPGFINMLVLNRSFRFNMQELPQPISGKRFMNAPCVRPHRRRFSNRRRSVLQLGFALGRPVHSLVCFYQHTTTRLNSDETSLPRFCTR